MRRLQLLASALMLATQVFVQVLSNTGSPASASSGEIKNQYQIVLNTKIPQALETKKAKVDFDSEVVEPLKIAQAKALQLAAEARARQIASQQTKRLIGPATGDAWYGLRLCESGNDYARNSGNGYYGAYQYNLGTWANYAGYSRPDLAPPEIQDAKARETQAARGWSPWPACSRKLGLM